MSVDAGPGVVIDLGDLRDGVALDPAPRRPRPPARWWRWVLPLVLAAGTVTAAAPAPGQPPPVALVPASESAGVTVDGDRLVVADGSGSPGGTGRSLAVYRLPDGAPRWRLPLADVGDLSALTVRAGTVLVSHTRPDTGEPSTTAVDLAGGQLRWRLPGLVQTTQDGGVLLEVGPLGSATTLRAVDPRSGVERWSLPVPGHQLNYRSGDRGLDRIVLVSSEGRVEVRDPGSAALVASGVLPALPDGASRPVLAVGDLLIADAGSNRLTGYGLDRLDRRWTVSAGAGQTVFPVDCGTVCVGNPGEGMRLLDPVTGRTRWSDRRWAMLWPVGGHLLAGRAPRPAGADHHVAAADLAVLDPDTGRVRGELGSWQLVGGPVTQRPLYGLRALDDRRVLLAELDVAAGETRPRAVLPKGTGPCGTRGGVLFCRRPGHLVVWDLGG